MPMYGQDLKGSGQSDGLSGNWRRTRVGVLTDLGGILIYGQPGRLYIGDQVVGDLFTDKCKAMISL